MLTLSATTITLSATSNKITADTLLILSGISHAIWNDTEGHNIQMITILNFILVESQLQIPKTPAEVASRNMGVRVQKYYKKNGYAYTSPQLLCIVWDMYILTYIFVNAWTVELTLIYIGNPNFEVLINTFTKSVNLTANIKLWLRCIYVSREHSGPF